MPMLDFQLPSFSLGMDHDFHPFGGSTSLEPGSGPSNNLNMHQHEDENIFQAHIMDSDADTANDMATPVLKRLRRGLKHQSVDFSCNIDDEIEEFSSPERSCVDDFSSAQSQPVCGSSKFPLPRSGAITASHSKVGKRKPIFDTPASANMEMNDKKLRFPNLTISPLRKFLLVDSDPDDSSDIARVPTKTNHSSKIKQDAAQKKKESVLDGDQGKDLWKDFCSIEAFSVPKPALEKVSEEYFKGVAPKLPTKCIQDVDLKLDLGSSSPPSHRYFFHQNPKVQKLVRGRLCSFSPLDALSNHENIHLDATTVDYKEQFNHHEGSKREGAKCSTRGGTKSKQSSASDSNVSSTGHWYTASDARKVYVTKNGEELTGPAAYRHYKKMDEARSRRYKK